MSNSRWNAAIVAILAGGAFLRAHDLNNGWVGKHNAWGGAMYGGIARNTVRYGWWATGFGPVTNSGRVSPEHFEYYYHYPPLLNWMVSSAFSVFGVHEWSARIVPILFSVALMVLIFVLAQRLFSNGVAMIALLFSSVIPVEAFYGAHVDVYNSLPVFFTALAVCGYSRWLESSRGRDLALCVAGVVLGCMSAWFTFFLVPLVVVHYFFLRDNGNAAVDRRIWLIPLGAVAVFALFLLHRHFLLMGGKTELMGSLLDKLRLRTSIETPAGQNTDIAGLALKHERDLRRLYSDPLLLLAASWVVFLAADAVRRRLQLRDWIVMMLFGYGFLHNLIFPSLLLGHDYMVVCYVPAIAISSAVVVDRLGARVRRTWGEAPYGAALATMLLVTLSAETSATRRLYSDESQYGNTLRRWGTAIQSQSRDTDLVFTCSGEDHILDYYADRQMKFSIETPQQLQAASKQRAGRLLACPETETAKHPELTQYLDAAYQRRNVAGMTLYDLSR